MPVVSLTWVEDEGCSLAASRCELLGCCSLAASIWELLCCSLAASRCELLGCSLAASRWAIGWSLAASRCETVCWSLAGLQLRSLKQNTKLADFPVARHWTNQSKIILKFWFLNTAVFKETVSHISSFSLRHMGGGVAGPGLPVGVWPPTSIISSSSYGSITELFRNIRIIYGLLCTMFLVFFKPVPLTWTLYYTLSQNNLTLSALNPSLSRL